MASLDSLPPDQRAVLQLVLQRGRSYDDIAKLLSIDRAAVRQRALSALDAIGPQTRVEPDRRALITDYLLGQLPDAVAADTRDRLAGSASERAWARVLSFELQPLASEPLPEIPADTGRTPAAGPAPAGAPAPATAPTEMPTATPAAPPESDDSQTVGAAAAGATGTPTADTEETPRRIPPAYGAPAPSAGDGGRPRSLVGGAILLGIIVIAIIVVVVILATGGSSKKSPVASTPTTTPATTSTPGGTTSTPSTTPTTPTTTTPTKPIAQANLISPTGAKKTAGVAIALKQGSTTAIVVRAQGVPANSKHDAYAVWLANPGGNHVLLGFVSPPVNNTGQLETVGKLPPNAASYKEVLVTLETVAKPSGPGKIILEGQPAAGQQF
jgi:hypothetical protein